jgi:NAD(P)-dependent dehydrogenase (short-subunit alcohol dehydrogenase family)
VFNLRGKVALVTGGDRGIGKAIAWALAEAGADVAVNYLREADKAEAIVLMIRKLGQRSIAVRGDVSRKDEVEAMVARVEQELGGPDILVNNAGILLFEPFLTMSESNWDKVIDVNLKGQFLVAQAVARGMVRRGKGGRILNLASIASGQVGVGYPNIAHYCASKGGVIAMTEVMALELGPHGISVNAIAPGIIGTDMTSDLVADPAAQNSLLARIPKGRIGRPEDVAALAVFLASDEAEYCNGATFYVDGGWLAG